MAAGPPPGWQAQWWEWRGWMFKSPLQSHHTEVPDGSVQTSRPCDGAFVLRSFITEFLCVLEAESEAKSSLQVKV